MTDGAPLQIARDAEGDVVVVRAVGEVDLTNAEALQRAVEETTARGVVLDVSRLAYVDSSGIRAIERGFRSLRSEERSLVVVAPAETAAAWTFRVAGFDDAVMHESVDSALESLASR
jgi:anti-sigma B factor antagonist